QWNPGTDANPNTGGLPGNIPHYAFAKDDGFSLNAVDIALDKPEDSSAWAAGYHVELMYGANSVGVGLSGSSTSYGVPNATLRSAYIRLHTPIGGNGIDWQIGVFDSIIGYESNSDPLNPNYTRSYGYTIEPTTMTGILGTYKVNDEVSFSAGIANNDGGLGPIAPSFVKTTTTESSSTYMGSVSLTAPDSMGFLKGATMSAGVVYGTDGYISLPPGASGFGNNTSWYLGATIPTPMTQLKLGAAFDYLMEPDFSSTDKNQGNSIWDIAGYATYQATDKFSINLRGEVMKDASQGDSNVNLYPGVNGDTHQYAEEVTVTLQYNLWANVITRGEFRWDHTDDNNFGASSINGDPTRPNDFLLALNVIYQF
ncbi:MAG TPA: outer membrane beta-barrel protein, partial [Pseudomonadales bacterium]|nr:outer membrane beta-barrel protein [Pseudomonadales bacterium]